MLQNSTTFEPENQQRYINQLWQFMTLYYAKQLKKSTQPTLAPSNDGAIL